MTELEIKLKKVEKETLEKSLNIILNILDLHQAGNGPIVQRIRLIVNKEIQDEINYINQKVIKLINEFEVK